MDKRDAVWILGYLFSYFSRLLLDLFDFLLAGNGREENIGCVCLACDSAGLWGYRDRK